MEKRKIILTVILATLLAFIVIYFVNKPQEPVAPTEQKEEVVQEEPAVNIEPSATINSQPSVEKTKTVQKKTVNKSEAPKPKFEEPKADTVQLESSVVTEGEPSELEEEGIVVPVKYSSKNIYKYVYTPARFKKN